MNDWLSMSSVVAGAAVSVPATAASMWFWLRGRLREDSAGQAAGQTLTAALATQRQMYEAIIVAMSAAHAREKADKDAQIDRLIAELAKSEGKLKIAIDRLHRRESELMALARKIDPTLGELGEVDPLTEPLVAEAERRAGQKAAAKVLDAVADEYGLPPRPGHGWDVHTIPLDEWDRTRAQRRSDDHA
jgi:hypothetical protein